jgi:hypothetical protein
LDVCAARTAFFNQKRTASEACTEIHNSKLMTQHLYLPLPAIAES